MADNSVIGEAQEKGKKEKTSLEILEENLMRFVTPGHFLGTQGLHLDRYFDKDTLHSLPNWDMHLGYQIYGLRKHPGTEWIDEAEIIVAAGAAREFAKPISVYTGKRYAYAGDVIKFRPKYQELINGKKILVCEDVITSGGTVLKLIEEVRKAGGTVVGVVSICTWSRVDFGVPSFSFLNLDSRKWNPEAGPCELCEKGIPLDKSLGHAGR